MIFQEPGASLNPVMQVKEQMQETIIAHEPGIDRKVLDEKCLNLLRETGIKDAQRVYESYPHQLSGGLHQRVMIAIALSCNPEMLIADEPTTALDVTVQAQIVRLLKRLIKDRGLTLVLITHDLHLALELAHRVVVMYAGEIVEDAQISGVKDASHPYTRALFEIIPDMQSRKSDFCVIPGSLPDMRVFMDRCYFSDRCGRVREKCLHKHPDMGKGVRCYFPYK
jgi:oligopeptide/dipeptide ABC transporter ATP-binding protein